MVFIWTVYEGLEYCFAVFLLFSTVWVPNVVLEEERSNKNSLLCAVPQESLLCPFYMKPLGKSSDTIRKWPGKWSTSGSMKCCWLFDARYGASCLERGSAMALPPEAILGLFFFFASYWTVSNIPSWGKAIEKVTGLQLMRILQETDYLF